MSTPWQRALAAIAITSLAGFAGVVDADPCVLSTGLERVTIGEKTPVCLVVNPLVWEVNDDPQNRYGQVLITPKADEFSRFAINGSWQNVADVFDPMLIHFGNSVGVHVESLGKYSFQKSYRLADDAKTFPIFTAIIAVDRGEVTGISWDDGCHFCSSSRCEDNTYTYNGTLTEDAGKDCYWPDNECIKDDTVKSLCQLTVYVVWTGTDSKGNYFTSHAKRLSLYSGQSLDDYLDDAANTYKTFDVPEDASE